MRQEKDAALDEKAKLLQNDALPLLEELRGLGFDINSTCDFVNTATFYPIAVLILLKHLRKPYIDRNREAIARALAVPGAAYAWPLLKEEYKLSPPSSGVKNGLAVALVAVDSEDFIEEIIDLIRDKLNGESQVILLQALRKSNSVSILVALTELANDPVLAKEIASWTFAEVR